MRYVVGSSGYRSTPNNNSMHSLSGSTEVSHQNAFLRGSSVDALTLPRQPSTIALRLLLRYYVIASGMRASPYNSTQLSLLSTVHTYTLEDLLEQYSAYSRAVHYM